MKKRNHTHRTEEDVNSKSQRDSSSTSQCGCAINQTNVISTVEFILHVLLLLYPSPECSGEVGVIVHTSDRPLLKWGFYYLAREPRGVIRRRAYQSTNRSLCCISWVFLYCLQVIGFHKTSSGKSRVRGVALNTFTSHHRQGGSPDRNWW